MSYKGKTINIPIPKVTSAKFLGIYIDHILHGLIILINYIIQTCKKHMNLSKIAYLLPKNTHISQY